MNKVYSDPQIAVRGVRGRLRVGVFCTEDAL